ncbi:MAG: cell wall-binding repeat-containing protein [Gracilibacteraceae bacterium]|nr:cell wall-binding repeat-containing protein [Gracilibacteraceae bacterium]
MKANIKKAPILCFALALLLSAPLPIAAVDVEFISGQNRVETSVAISRHGWTAARTVILAPGANANLIDALAVAPLAGQEDAPILLSVDNRLDPAVITEIQRLGAKKVYAVGALQQSVVDQVYASIPNVEVKVLKGQDRFETAALINAEVQNPRGAFLVGYSALADAVSVASYAAANGYIIQVARPGGSYYADQAEFMQKSPEPSYIVGGPGLVQDISGVTRIFGANRYATNKLLRDSLNFDYSHIYTADGESLVDALTGSALAAKNKSAIVLTPYNDLDKADFGAITDSTKVYAFGGR